MHDTRALENQSSDKANTAYRQRISNERKKNVKQSWRGKRKRDVKKCKICNTQWICMSVLKANVWRFFARAGKFNEKKNAVKMLCFSFATEEEAREKESNKKKKQRFIFVT